MKSLLILFYRSVEGEEIGMLEDMEVGITDLQRVAFQITEAKTDDLSDLQPLVCGRRWDIIPFSLCFFFISCFNMFNKSLDMIMAYPKDKAVEYYNLSW